MGRQMSFNNTGKTMQWSEEKKKQTNNDLQHLNIKQQEFVGNFLCSGIVGKTVSTSDTG